MKRVNVDGLEALNEIIEKTDGKIFVLYTGSKVNGVSWCPDCVTAEPVIDKVLSSPSISDLDATFITCLVGQRDYWKNPECPFRTDPRIKINCIPTLAEWGNKVRRLLDSQLTNEHLIQDLLTSDD
ncbi:unnamed protein product, partial [Mesorhabditis belari]|uniref:Thioredoxin domain-containing protein 17 n=1 Tax=Mesorhabditis belari TaxID=2138241 RepID=A0AAF3EZ76_9BILA